RLRSIASMRTVPRSAEIPVAQQAGARGKAGAPALEPDHLSLCFDRPSPQHAFQQIATDQQLRERGALHGIEARRAVEAADLARDLFEGSPCLVGTESDGRPGDLIGHSVNSVLSDR